MTETDLDLMLSKHDVDACAAFFKGTSEHDRKALSSRTMQWFEAADALRISKLPVLKNFVLFGTGVPKRVQKALELVKQLKSDASLNRADHKDALQTCALAVLATCGITEVRRVGMHALPQTLEVLRDRNPRWLNKWMDFACECQPIGMWESVRGMERDGLAAAERNSHYWTSMALTLGQLDAEKLLANFDADAELLEILWGMLSDDQTMRGLADPSTVVKAPADNEWWDANVETWKQYSADLEKAAKASSIWKICLIEMAAAKKLDMDRLADVLFDWIARLSTDGESKATAGSSAGRPVVWFHTIMDELPLSDSQKDQMVTRYVGLLSTKDSATLVWALNHLNNAKVDQLPITDLLGNISNVFFVKRKEPAVAAIKLLEKLIKQMPKNTGIATALLDAFEHHSADVHKRALSVIKKNKLNEDSAFSQELNERMSGTAVLLREEAKSLNSPGSAGFQPALSESSLDIDELLQQASQVPTLFGEAAEIPAAVEAVIQTRLPAALSLNSRVIPRLDPDQQITPIESIDDLVFLVAQILDGNGSSESIEQALDGILRCCDQRPEDFATRVSSLNKRITSQLGEGPTALGLQFQGVSPVTDLAAVCRAWIVESKFQPSDLLKPVVDVLGNAFKSVMTARALEFFSARAESISQLVTQKISLPLLSAPTHKGGWIDPLVLPDRIKRWNDSGIKLDKADFIQALLRLAPDNRAEVLAKLGPDRNEYMDALRWALGAPLEGAMSTAPIWVAAFRCRDPRGNSAELARKFPGLGPDGAEPGGFKECLKESSAKSSGIFGTSFNHQKEGLVLTFDPPAKSRPSVKFFPTELLHTYDIGWQGSISLDLYWPLNPEPYFVHETRRVCSYLESQGAYWHSSWTSLFDPDTPTKGYGSWLIALGMSAKQLEVSRLCVDALISSIDDGRLDGTTFGTVIGKLYLTDKITLSRWIKGLRDVSRISPMHSHFVFKALEQFLPTIEAGIDGLSKPIPSAVLELLYDCCCNAPYRIELEAARKTLSGVTGKGKGAKLAQLLLQPSQPGASECIRQFAAQILSSRIERAKRWEQWSLEPALLSGGQARQPKSLVQFFRESPLLGLELDTERDSFYGAP